MNLPMAMPHISLRLRVAHAMRPARRAAAWCAAALFLWAWTAAAEDLVTRDGRAFSNVRVTRVEPDGIRILHDSGGIKILLKDLPDAWLLRFADPVRQAAEKAAQAAEALKTTSVDPALQARMREIEKGRVWLIGTITTITDRGLLVFARSPEVWDSFEATDKGADRLRGDGVAPSTPDASRRIAEKWIKSGADMLACYSYLSLIQRKDTAAEEVLPKRVTGTFLLKNHPDQPSLTPDNLVCVFAYPDGEFVHETALGTRIYPALNFKIPEALLAPQTQPEP